ncbi:MAG: hypothetical protein KKD64_12685 [Alphaproteobacteria bacterium]|nr:hypothetical protein [Alphaproteobacteria bacterium]MBU0792674.1 hypothetical protein [Alphaproteobacteria bacterium]MBU0877334.1 hypothetical protein [Alphaproteobacteria bacterium]MBU1770490.1 hypothetical protein [Alphaproteobacteria bacterium]
MIGIAILFAAALPTDLPQLQRQLDYVVARCRAEPVVRLIAHDKNQVELVMLTTGQLPTVSENSAFQCVLTKIKERPELHLGFTGNEATSKAKKN